MDFKSWHIFRVKLEPTQGSEQQGTTRPCVILSITPLNAKLRQVGLVPLSTSARSSQTTRQSKGLAQALACGLALT
ncbi:type II toxin-antitoxin system PemK/MazF family toxin [Limnohabitans sp.]|jgi:mRNA-degrading endonuclease toxin of MazEF toxin-antitoxin module|uniref:type II toxin-antitoxin system PemK/MazF family toxin n=1 Tax=Limnohabitans sp. TaxID=1907725 RepID=UPI0037C055FA